MAAVISWPFLKHLMCAELILEDGGSKLMSATVVHTVSHHGPGTPAVPLEQLKHFRRSEAGGTPKWEAS